MKKAKKKVLKVKPGIVAKVTIVAASRNTVTLSYQSTVDSAYFEAHNGTSGTMTFVADKPKL